MTGEFVDPDMIDAYAEMRGRIMIEMKKSFRSCLSTIAPRSWSLFAFKLYKVHNAEIEGRSALGVLRGQAEII